MTKQEALDKIKELESFVKNLRVETARMKIRDKRVEWGETYDKTLTLEEAKKWLKKKGGEWRLPTINELSEADIQGIKGFKNECYWSITKKNLDETYYYSFATGAKNSNYNNSPLGYVRCIRNIAYL
jgi:hypothetical protein